MGGEKEEEEEEQALQRIATHAQLGGCRMNGGRRLFRVESKQERRGRSELENRAKAGLEPVKIELFLLSNGSSIFSEEMKG